MTLVHYDKRTNAIVELRPKKRSLTVRNDQVPHDVVVKADFDKLVRSMRANNTAPRKQK